MDLLVHFVDGSAVIIAGVAHIEQGRLERIAVFKRGITALARRDRKINLIVKDLASADTVQK